VPGLSFCWLFRPKVLRGTAPERAFFLILAEVRYKARGKVKNGELEGFCVISTLQLKYEDNFEETGKTAPFRRLIIYAARAGCIF
jgi:hypothetical protein